LKKALDWIFENTTDLRYTSALEIGEEIILFYQLYRRAQTEKARDFCKNFINFRIKQIVDSGRLNNPTSGEITVFLPMCEIMLKLGLSLFDHKSFINQKVLSNSEIFSPGYDIWNVSILERLGFYPPIPLISLIPNGSIATEFQSGNLFRLMDSPNTDKMAEKSNKPLSKIQKRKAKWPKWPDNVPRPKPEELRRDKKKTA
jgi:hypothetical protein